MGVSQTGGPLGTLGRYGDDKGKMGVPIKDRTGDILINVQIVCRGSG